ncbi:hypothetical protein [Pseudobacteriovorax antillogorgiicola]|uniref:NAD(P)-dependent dehydrogenase, short-chain alcohol dehydrogenase family n=1 Tax=Pseudobacteriovorax antillogorgiicola TaxID=1513793 RepID=A0A1Y6BAX7_9BACT|nr:hypothetical protein [Pseudobacteriovorax antillogorgiicola]TCS58872.1 NAD(P)-dependent dehydrogenase (short-subunit alcohol dehydrogenase family) [Pseudobacteriovorax antillogorgiicola]SME93813.1 NAD(P)-dependent dehydrogenase, short-chain alcohol dehydrogenase family [Pseudobacteriovorax antillogorgiicola]
MIRIALVTDVSHDYGIICAKELAYRGYSVYVVSNARRDTLVRGIRAQTKNPHIYQIDGSLKNIDQANTIVELVDLKLEKLDLLIHSNVLPCKESLLEESNECIFVNYHLAPLRLNLGLLHLLQEVPQARIVHLHSKELNRGMVDIENAPTGHGLSARQCYRNSQLWSYLAMQALSEQLSAGSVTINSVYPGPIADYNSDFKTKLWNWLSPRPFSQSLNVELPLWIASSPLLSGVSGRMFFHQDPDHQAFSYPNEQALKRLVWQRSLSLVSHSPMGLVQGF